MKQKNSRWNLSTPTSLQSNKKKIAVMFLGAFIFSLTSGLRNVSVVHAETPGSVVINEIAWAGSVDSKNDEWIELYNTSDQDIDLSNWYFSKGSKNTKYKIMSGTIASHGYFLIENHESAVNSITSDAIINIPLSNSGTNLKLHDDKDQIIDAVNSDSLSWPAGNVSTKATMERIDPQVSGDLASNWATSAGNEDKASGNSDIIGTPKKANNLNGGQATAANSKIEIDLGLVSPKIGDMVTATIKAANVNNLFAYGFELNYDPAMLDFQSATEQNFLNANNTIQTSFQAGLENSTEGKLIVAGARTDQDRQGVEGSGDLLTLQFKMIGNDLKPESFHFDQSSFLATPKGDIKTQFINQPVEGGNNAQIAPVTNLKLTEGIEPYSINLSWDTSVNAKSYQIFRKNAHGEWLMLKKTPELTFTDKNDVKNGGFIVPQQTYEYQIIAVNGSNTSTPTTGSQKETRGLKGDNNRTNRIDGRDLEKLARHFGETDGDKSFDRLVDTTYDGTIDGSDLIDIGANFALKYNN